MDMDDFTDDNYGDEEEEDEMLDDADDNDEEIDVDEDFGLSDMEKASVAERSASGKPSASKGAGDEFKYEVLTPDMIVHHMVECIKEVNQVVQLPATTTRILLHHFRWDKEKLMERFYDGDQERLFKEAHIVSPFKSQAGQARRSLSSQKSLGSAKDAKDVYCEICCTQKQDDNMTGLECGHVFCKACWREYLTTKIMDEGMGQVFLRPLWRLCLFFRWGFLLI